MGKSGLELANEEYRKWDRELERLPEGSPRSVRLRIRRRRERWLRRKLGLDSRYKVKRETAGGGRLPAEVAQEVEMRERVQKIKDVLGG